MLHTPRTLLALSFAAALGVIAMDGAPRAAGPGQAPQEPPPAGRPPSPPPAASGQEPAQQPPQQEPAQQQPTFRAGVNFVRVDVIVTGKDGQPVENLSAADFQVTEDGKPQEIETFRFVSISGNTGPGEQAPRAIRSDYDEEAEAAQDDVRLFAIFLDEYHVRRGNSMSVKKPLIHFVQTQLGDRDMVGIMYPLTPVSAVRMTRNRQEIISAIERFEGRKYDYRPRNEFEDRYAMYPAATVERIRNQVAMGALRSLVLRLGGLREGRKAVVLVSEGYSNILPPQLNDPVASFPGLGNPARGNAGVESDERTDFFMNLDIYQELRQVYDSANRSNTTIYALDPRGLTPFEFDINEGVGQDTDRRYLQSTGDSLRTLAGETDGRAIVSQNDLEGGLRQVVRDSSAYYLIGYSSTQPRADGKFHEIKVKVSRPGVQVRARRGYWALTEEEMERSMTPPRPSAPPEVTRALGAVTEERRARFVRTWIGTARGENGMTRVTFAWESVPPVAGSSAESRLQASSVQLLAAGAGAGRPY
ncbi:MAG TPA: VWA domain-containing protein, partial [Vicinamibacterales bacterium]|nr:VWA domain-containing protein [Vicinamibacterales bacterium]